jgi:hypothetical protein
LNQFLQREAILHDPGLAPGVPDIGHRAREQRPSLAPHLASGARRLLLPNQPGRGGAVLTVPVTARTTPKNYGKGVGVQEKWRNNPLHLRNYLTIRHPDGALIRLSGCSSRGGGRKRSISRIYDRLSGVCTRSNSAEAPASADCGGQALAALIRPRRSGSRVSAEKSRQAPTHSAEAIAFGLASGRAQPAQRPAIPQECRSAWPH